MKRNPFLKIPYKINRKLYSNTAVLNYNVSHYDWETGEMTTSVFTRTIYVDNPKKVSSFLIDGEDIKADDTILKCAYLDILNSKSSQSNDPVITENGVIKTLSDLRPMNLKNGGIDRQSDTLEFCGIIYQFKNIEAKDFYSNIPTEYSFQLREGT